MENFDIFMMIILKIFGIYSKMAKMRVFHFLDNFYKNIDKNPFIRLVRFYKFIACYKMCKMG